MTDLELTYLYNSGFIVRCGDYTLVFDYYTDPRGNLPEVLAGGGKTWFFSSHRHMDHFNPAIAKFPAQQYILSDDIQYDAGAVKIDRRKSVYMAPYETFTSDGVRVETYGSTDEGVSFVVELDGWRIFHAGDFNWWHWAGDTPENIAQAKKLFFQEMERLAGQSFDVAFFPVDNRLGEYRAIGVEAFCRRVAVRRLVAMHLRGPAWTPSAAFPGGGRPVKVWCPLQSGEKIMVAKEPSHA